MSTVRRYQDLDVYQNAFTSAMTLFNLSKLFPRFETYSLTDQIRRSSRSVCSSIAEAWRKRRYPAHFVSKLTDAEMEAEETRVWLEFARGCGYLTETRVEELDKTYNIILGQLEVMIRNPERWTLR